MALDRNQVPAERKWRVEDIFENVEAWNALYAECEGELDFSEFEGKLNTVESVLSCMEKLNALVLKLNKLAATTRTAASRSSPPCPPASPCWP